jgi:RsiW-degrading membrane proteinase PrsW (M82 family)
MVVSALPIWVVLIIALVITAVYYFRHRKTWMGNWLVIALVFVGHFFFFAWGVIIFLVGEIIRSKFKDSNKEKTGV